MNKLREKVIHFWLFSRSFRIKLIKHFIGLLLAPLPFLLIPLLHLIISGSNEREIHGSIFWATIFAVLIYMAEIFIALPILLLNKRKLTYKYTVFFGIMIGFLIALLLTYLEYYSYQNNDITRYFNSNAIGQYLLGIIVSFIVSSCFWVTNELINKIFKVENNN